MSKTTDKIKATIETDQAAQQPTTSAKPAVETFANESIAYDLDTTEVLIERFKDETTLVGPPVMIRGLYEMAEALAASDHMKRWCALKIAAALKQGDRFGYRGATGNLRAIYRLCTTDDVRSLSQKGSYVDAVTRSSDVAGSGQKDVTDRIGKQKVSHKVAAGKRSSSTRAFNILPPGKKDDELVGQLQGQVKAVLMVLRDHVGPKGGRMVLAEIETVLEAGRERLKTKPERRLLDLFSFCYNQQYAKIGGLVTREESDAS